MGYSRLSVDEDSEIDECSLDQPVEGVIELEDDDPKDANFSKSHCSYGFFVTILKKRIPIFDWLPNYHLNYLLNDFVSGFTIFVILIPQGVSYALLAGVPPQYGFYTCIVPIITYAIFGTSKHLSIGPFAIVCLLVATQVRASLSVAPDPSIEFSEEVVQSTIAMSLVTGLFLMLFGLLRFGFITMFLSPALLSGLTCGGSFEIVTSQIKHFFGLSIPSQPAPFTIFKTFYFVFKHIKEVNLLTLGIGLISLLVLASFKYINRRYKKQLYIPLPGELIVCVIATIISSLCHLNEKFNLSVIGDIPDGLPIPALPNFKYVNIGQFLISSALVAIIIFIISISLAKKFSSELKYSINSNQELFALGMANCLGSFFLSIPASGSLSRTAVTVSIGTHSQLNSLIVASLMIVFLLFLTKYFTALPKVILATIIIVAMRGMMKQVKDIAAYYKIKRSDSAVWLVSFLSVILFGFANGILISVGFNLCVIIYFIGFPKVERLGLLNEESKSYGAVSDHIGCNEVEGVLIMRMNMPLWYINIDHVVGQLKNTFLERANELPIKAIIFDLSSVSDIDSAADTGLVNFIMEMKNDHNIKVYLTGMKPSVENVLKKGIFFKTYSEANVQFETVDDCVQYFSTTNTTSNQAENEES